MREMQALVQNYVLNRDRQMKYLAVLIALSLFVSFMVPFILMQPADSMAEASVCEIEEHVHTVEAGCYQLFCVPEGEEEHVHTDLCYGLICEKIVHTHTPDCHPSQPDFSALFSALYDPNNLKATANGTNYANSPKDKPSEYQAPPGSLLGVATHFHIFAESVALRSHVHGNIATNYLLENGAFGVYNDRLNGMSSINYIRNLGPNASLDNAFQTQLIMGHDYSSPPSPWFVNRYEIRDKKNRKTYYIPKDKFPAWGADGYVEPQLKFEKPDRPYINITQELNKFANMSMELVDSAKTANYQSIISDQNGNFSGNKYEAGKVTVTNQGENLILDFSQIDDKYIYYTIDATDFGMNAPWSTWMKVLQIKGITEDKFLFLNVDVGTNPNAYFSKSWMVYQNDNQNNTYGTGEVTLGEGGTRVIYNIVSSDGNGGNYKPFEGDAVFGERRNGSILAPNADVNVAGNTNGTIIARNFVATGESHRCDVQQEGTESDDSDWTLEVQEPTTEAPKPSEPAKKLHIDVEKKWSGGTVNQDITIRLYKSFEPNLNVNTATLTDTGKTVTLNSGNSWKAKFSDLPAYENDKTVYYYVKETTAVDKYTASYDKNGISVDPGKVIVTNTKEKEIAVTVKKVWNPETIAPTATQETRTYKIMPIGDSLTEGYSERLQWGNHGYRKYLDYFLKDKNYEIDMVGPRGSDTNTATFPLGTGEITYTYDNNHAGYSGYLIEDVLSALENADAGAVKNAQPDIVLLTIGTNNMNNNQNPADCEQKLRNLIDHILTNIPSDSMLFLTSIPEFKHNYGNNDYVDVTEYNAMVERVAQSYANSLKNVRFVDENKWVTLDDLVHATNDWIHPTDSGYEKIGRAWAEVIDSYIQDTKAIESVPAEVRNPIKVKLYRSTNGNLNAANASDVNQMEYVTTAELNSENGWTCKFDSLPAMSGNQLLYYYAVEENVPDHYTVTYQNNAVNSNDGTIIATNTKEKLMNITLDKTWVGEKPQNEQVTVELYQSTERNLDMSVSDAEITQLVNQGKVKKLSEVKLTAGENPHFTNLPIYQADGKTMYYYYVREKDVAGYKASYSKNPNYGGDKQVTITNTKLISVEATKDWQFENNTTLQHMANTEITVELYKYKHVPVEGEMYYIPTTFIPLGAEYLKSMTLKGDNSKATFDNLPIEEDGYKLFYYVREVPQDAITKDFDVIYGTDNNGQLVDPNVTATLSKTIINKEKASTEISITINKNWDVSDFFNDLNGNGLFEPPNEYYVQDSVNPVEKWADPIKVTLQYSTDGTNWQDYTAYKDVELYTTYTFTNLPKQIGGQNVYYKVVETYNYGYVTDYGTNNNVNASSIQKGQATPEITLKNTILKRSLNVKKNWYGNIDKGVDKVVVEIYRRTTNKKPDLGINPDGTYTPGTPSTPFNPVEVLKTTFDANDTTKDGWTVHGNTQSSQGTAGINNDGYTLYCGDANDLSYISYTLDVVPGATYSFSTMTNRAKYTVLKVDYGNGTLEKVAEGDANAEDWVSNKVEGTFTVPDGVTSVTLQVGLNSAASYGPRFDDITVTQLTAGTPVTPNPYINSFDNNTTEGWTQVGNHKNDTTQSGLQSSPTYDGSAYSYGLISQNGTANGAVSDLSGYYYCSYIQKEFTDLTAGSTYNFSTKVTRTTGDPVYVALRAVYNDGTPVEIARVQTTANKIDWKELAGDFTVPAGTTNVKLQIVPITNSGYMGTMMYVDDVKVELVSTGSGSTEQPTEAPTQAPTNPPSEDVPVVKSWSFENQYYLDGWESHNGGNPTYTKKDGIPVPDGSSWVEITVTSADMGMKATDWNNVVAGSKYLISAQVSRGDYSTTGVQIKVNDANSGTTLATITGNAPNGGWNAVSGYFVPTSGEIQIFVTAPNAPGDTLAIDAITITGPYPSSDSKPRNVETFFSGSNTLTKRQLNIEKLGSNKLAKNINDYKTIDVTIPKSNYSVNDDGGYNITPFTLASSTDLEFMRGAKFSHLEVHFRQGGTHFNFPGNAPTNTNMYFDDNKYLGWNYEMNADKTIHSFEAKADYTITEKSVLMSQTPINPENIERVILKCKDGSMLVINNVKTERTQVSDTTNTKDITLSDSSYTGVWFNSSESSELNNLWAGQKIAGIDVYFDADAAVESGDLSNDISVVKNAISGGSAHGASINKFGFYLMLNRDASDGAWGGEFTAESVSVGTEWVSSSNTNMKVAKYTINTGDTWQGRDDYSDGTNKSQLQSGKYSSIIFLTKMSEDIKAIVVRTESGQKYELTNTVYPATVKQDPLTTSTEKWYPILNSYETGEENQNTNRDATYDILLTPEEMKEHLGKTVQNVQVSVRGNAAGAVCQTYIKHSDGTGGNLLGTTNWNGTVKTYEGNGIVVQDNTRLVFRAMPDDANDTNPTSKFEKVVVNFTDGTSYTVWNMNYVPFEEYHKGHETSFVTNGTTNLLNNPSTYEGYYDGREIDYITVSYGEDGDQFVSVPRDLISLDGTQGTPAIDGGVSMKHTYSGVKNVDVLKVIEDASDDFTLAEIKEIKIHYNDGFGSTYTITNTDYSPKAEATPPAIGNQPALGSDFVFISTLDLTKENGWKAALEGLPVTDGQGNAYEYVIVEKNVYGEGADRYQLVSYEHPDGVILDEDGKQTSFLNTTTDEENGLVIMPSSGGEGKTWFYVAGVALMLCGIAGCYGMKRWQRSRR